MAKREDEPDLKKEVKTLKRQLARAHREISRLQGTVEEKEEQVTTKTEATCPKCGSTNLGEISTPTGKKFVSCRDCKKWRSRA
jgi:hypothetical protein